VALYLYQIPTRGFSHDKVNASLPRVQAELINGTGRFKEIKGTRSITVRTSHQLKERLGEFIGIFPSLIPCLRSDLF
jgi:hypothetical protein